MAEAKQIRAIKGVRDITPPTSAAWDHVEATAREVFSTFGYGEIRLPIFEHTELFSRSVGADTDIVGKEMYSWPDPLDPNEIIEWSEQARKQNPFPEVYGVLRYTLFNVAPKDRFIALRPEATASVCRAYIEHGMQTLPGNVKLYYIGPMFRRERPQKGRYRQFYQIGAEVLGQSDAPGIDAELIEMLLAFFAKTGLEGAALAVNSIGCKNCRPKYVELLREALRNVKDQLGADSQRRIETNPLRVLDSKIPDEQPIIEKLPRISDHLCEDCRAHFAELERQLALRNISYERNWRLVRGLDYYTRTTFEITAPGLGSQNAVCGGGRYDGLVELLGGPPTKGIGFAIGTDRLMMSLESQGKLATQPAVDVFIVWMGPAAEKTAIALARRLRNAGIKVELPASEMKLGKALGLGDKLGARYGLIIGDNEVASSRFTLKRLADAQQKSLSEQELLSELKANL